MISFGKGLHEYALFKTKKLRGRETKCMIRELRKAIMDRSTVSHKNY